MLQLSVKASQITNLTDARYFAAREVEWIGFSVDTGSESAVQPQKINAIKEWVEGPKIVAEFGLQTLDEIKSLVEYLQVDAIQINMLSDAIAISEIVDLPILKEIVIDSEDFSDVQTMIKTQEAIVEFFILDFAKNNFKIETLNNDSFQLLKTLCASHKILFSINDQKEIISDFIERVKPYGLVLLGGEEEMVGFKSFDELDEILDLLEVNE